MLNLQTTEKNERCSEGGFCQIPEENLFLSLFIAFCTEIHIESQVSLQLLLLLWSWCVNNPAEEDGGERNVSAIFDNLRRYREY